jgi:hypothetical protein
VQKYPVSPKVAKGLELPSLSETVSEIFGSSRQEGGFVHTQFGALKDLKVSAEGRSLVVETTMDPSVPLEVQQDTIRRYNSFLERATGYTSKQRAKKLQEAAKKGTPGA